MLFTITPDICTEPVLTVISKFKTQTNNMNFDAHANRAQRNTKLNPLLVFSDVNIGPK